MYEFTSRVRYSEIGQSGHMKLSSIAARMQDCCVFHSDAVGNGPLNWMDRKKGWIILSWQIVIHDYPKFSEPVTTKTWAYRFHVCEGDRNFTMRAEDGTLLAEANSRWVFFDFDTQRMARVPEEEARGYGIEEKIPYLDAPRRIALPKEEAEEQESFEVVRTNLDTNQHVNNLQYIDMALAYLPQGFKVRELRVEYARQMKLGDVVRPKTWRTEDAFFVSLCDSVGTPCANCEFML